MQKIRSMQMKRKTSTHLAHKLHKAYPSLFALPLLDLLLHHGHICTQGDDLSIVIVYEVVGIALDQRIPVLHLLIEICELLLEDYD